MKKTLIALVVTNMAWAGYVLADTTTGSGVLSLPVGHLLAGVSPLNQAQIIQVDEKGYAICSKEQPKP